MRGRKIEPFPTGLWYKLRDKVDKHILRAVQEVFYGHLTHLKQKGLLWINLFLLTGKSFTEIAAPDCDLILYYFFANYFSNFIKIMFIIRF